MVRSLSRSWARGLSSSDGAADAGAAGGGHRPGGAVVMLSSGLGALEGARTPVWLAWLPADGPTGGLFRDQAPLPF